MRKIVVSIILLLFILSNIPAATVASLTNHPDEDYPLSHTIKREEGKTPVLKLLPSDLSESRNIYSRFADYKPAITIERLYRIKLPAEYVADSRESRRKLFVRILNILGKPETLIGYTYHSSRKNKDIVLIEDSYISDKKGRRIKGFHFEAGDIPEKFSYYQFVDDVNSSGTVFEQNLVIKDVYMGYRSSNIRSVKIFIIPVMKKDGTRTEMLFFPSGGYLYIYNSSQILKEPAAKALGISVNVSSMFKKRMDIMTKWIGDQLAGSDR